MNGAEKRKNNEGTAFLEGYLTACQEMEVPLRAVCERLGEILREKGTRTGKHLSFVRADAKRDTPKRKTVEPLESDGNSHRRTPSRKKKIRNMKWWYKLSKAEKQAIIAKRIAGMRVTRAMKKEAA